MRYLDAPEGVITVHQLCGCAQIIENASVAGFFGPYPDNLPPQILRGVKFHRAR